MEEKGQNEESFDFNEEYSQQGINELIHKLMKEDNGKKPGVMGKVK